MIKTENSGFDIARWIPNASFSGTKTWRLGGSLRAILFSAIFCLCLLRGPKKTYFLWSLEVFAHQKVSPLSPRRSRRQISTRSSIWNSNERKRPSVPSCPNRSTPNGFWMNMILPQWLAVPPWESCNKQQLDFWISTVFFVFWMFVCWYLLSEYWSDQLLFSP